MIWGSTVKANKTLLGQAVQVNLFQKHLFLHQQNIVH